ncbi:unnamed protein product [marine sediment metagenome]|uniref:Uncharacterized protein n=1 Tax=marine sediment metagenome TaxID=412755 RepID=X1EAR1_9ZZZZ
MTEIKVVDVEKVMDRKKVADAIHSIIDTGVDFLSKDNFKPQDHTKIKLLRTLGVHINSAVTMIQQETAQQRISLLSARMKQLGYGEDQ